MERKEQFPGQGKGPVKRSVFDQPRKVVSGMVYSGAIIGMLVISLAFSVTVAVLSKTLGMTVDEISQTDVYKYFSYLLYQIVYRDAVYGKHGVQEIKLWALVGPGKDVWKLLVKNKGGFAVRLQGNSFQDLLLIFIFHRKIYRYLIDDLFNII